VSVVIGIEARRTVHGISTAVEVVGMQPLVVLANSHAGAVTVGDGHLLVITVGALLDAEVVVGIGK
jgi:hypothetical protein